MLSGWAASPDPPFTAPPVSYWRMGSAHHSQTSGDGPCLLLISRKYRNRGWRRPCLVEVLGWRIVIMANDVDPVNHSRVGRYSGVKTQNDR